MDGFGPQVITSREYRSGTNRLAADETDLFQNSSLELSFLSAAAPKLDSFEIPRAIHGVGSITWPFKDLRKPGSVDPAVYHGKTCIRGTRIMVAAGVPRTEILASYPSIKSEDMDAALTYAAFRNRARQIDAHV